MLIYPSTEGFFIVDHHKNIKYFSKISRLKITKCEKFEKKVGKKREKSRKKVGNIYQIGGKFFNLGGKNPGNLDKDSGKNLNIIGKIQKI
jgi:hypothetical protein